MATWTLEPTRETLHGVFSKDIAPVITIDPGDTVIFRTLDAAWSLERPVSLTPLVEGKKLEPLNPDWMPGHCLSGPIAVRGAEPGMTLEVAIDEIQVGPWGWTGACGWPHPVNERLGLDTAPHSPHLWEIEDGIATDQLGFQVALRPFMGVMGLAPAEPGEHSTGPPRRTGGNLDCKELVAGTSLFLPIEVPGALFSTGDGHGVQGDGEVSVTAIECGMDRVAMTFRLHPKMRLTSPRARTPAAWITLGLHEDLQEAAYLALEDMLDLMCDVHELDRRDALALASLTVDLRVTQIVNGVRGVHAVLRDGAFNKGAKQKS